MRIFDIVNNRVVLNEHVAQIKEFRDVYHMDNGDRILAYCFYLTCPYPDINPFFYIEELNKKSTILRSLEISEDMVEDDRVKRCLSLMEEMFLTPLIRINVVFKKKIEELARALNSMSMSKVENMEVFIRTMKEYKTISAMYKQSIEDIIAERELKVKGNILEPYDQ